MTSSKYTTKILVVDDERLIRLTLSAKLKAAGYEPVAVGTAAEALAILKKRHKSFSAVISDIMMDDLDGFEFRNAVRMFDPIMPFFFITALDPEEGSGFLKRIVDDPQSYYLPKSADTGVLVKRVQRIVVSRRIEQYIENQVNETNRSLILAAHVQRSMLPPRAKMTERGFYTTWWRPKEVVSGDLFEAVPFGPRRYLYVLGDIQGHGTSAALAMTAVQAFLRQLGSTETLPQSSPSDIANLLQKFFRTSLTDVSYMTAVICIHSPEDESIRWISCGAPDPLVVDGGRAVETNPERRGGLPIGLMADTVYGAGDEVSTPLPASAVCVAFTDGVLDIYRKGGATEGLPLQPDMLNGYIADFFSEARKDGSVVAALHRVMRACEDCGYVEMHDDVTALAFGAHLRPAGVFEASVPVSPEHIDKLAQTVGEWCADEGWPEDAVPRIQLVLEEKLMNVYDHGFDDRERLHEVVNVRLRRVRDGYALTVWDTGTPEPSIAVAAGDPGTAFELINRSMSGRGRGRLMVRELCSGVERRRFCGMNETVYHIPRSPASKQDAQSEKGPAAQ
jgi:serine phosphatase RsbU (regulator of sigma subunit)/anti-sigma regulatory factor (Ser/Thr protein kinase)